MTVFIRTSPFGDNEQQYCNSASGELLLPSCDTRDFIELANHLLKRIWKDGFRYAKAGVMLSDFTIQACFNQDYSMTYRPALIASS